MTSNSQRETFENWFKQRAGYEPMWSHGCYTVDLPQAAWNAWQAATSHLMPAIKEARDMLTRWHDADLVAIQHKLMEDTEKALATLNAIIKE